MTQLATDDYAVVSVIDSHTGGMPTRVITGGFPELEGDTVSRRRDDLARRFSRLTKAVTEEPRGWEAMVAALLVPPDSPESAAGVIFFDRAEVIGMCGHGTIGLAHTLRALGRLGEGAHRLDTPVGPVRVECLPDGRVAVGNVPSRRLASGLTLQVEGVGEVIADIAYGGNTFLLVNSPDIDLGQPREALLVITRNIMTAARRAGFKDVDHIELYGPPTREDADSRNFVLCPSGTYDRSPCGTGTSAKAACLAEDGQLEPEEEWVQESITGSTFTVTYQWADRESALIAPVVTGEAEIIAHGELLLSPQDMEPGKSRSAAFAIL